MKNVLNFKKKEPRSLDHDAVTRVISELSAIMGKPYTKEKSNCEDYYDLLIGVYMTFDWACGVMLRIDSESDDPVLIMVSDAWRRNPLNQVKFKKITNLLSVSIQLV